MVLTLLTTQTHSPPTSTHSLARSRLPQLTLFVIGSAGFGRRVSWLERGAVPADTDTGHTMSFKDALDVVGHKLFYRLVFPGWALRWGTPGMRRFGKAYREIEVSRESVCCCALCSVRRARVSVSRSELGPGAQASDLGTREMGG